MDLAKFSKLGTNDGAWLHLESPVTGAGKLYADDETKQKPVRLRVLGKDSTTARRVANEVSVERLNKTVGKGGGRFKFTVEDLDAARLRLVVACTVGWENVLEGGTELPYAQDKVAGLVERNSWIIEQVEEFMGAREFFLGN